MATSYSQRRRSAKGRRHTAKRQRARLQFERLEGRLLLATVAWDGGPVATGTDWNIGANWVGDALPTATDDVQIGAAFAGITITYATASATIRSLTSEASLQIINGSLSILATTDAPHSRISSSLSIDGGIFTLSNTTLDGPGQLINASSLTVSTSTISASLENRGLLSITGSASTINGAFHNAAGASLLVSGSGGSTGTLTVANGFTNEGTITLNTTGNPFGSGDGSATLNVTSGLLVNATGATILATKTVGQGTNFLNAALDNRGTLTVDHRLTIDKPSAEHSNSGTINLRNDDLTVSQAGTSPSFGTSGTIDITAGRILTVSGGTFHYDAGTLSGTGTFVLSSTTAQITPDLNPPFNIELRVPRSMAPET